MHIRCNSGVIIYEMLSIEPGLQKVGAVVTVSTAYDVWGWRNWGCPGLILAPECSIDQWWFFFLPHQPKLITHECGQGNNVTILRVRIDDQLYFKGKTPTYLPHNYRPKWTWFPPPQ